MRDKKAWRKSIDQGALQATLEQNNRLKEVEAQRSAIADSELFTVAKKATLSDKDKSLKQKREKLRKDRFKEKERTTTSKYEEEIVKKLIQKRKEPE